MTYLAPVLMTAIIGLLLLFYVRMQHRYELDRKDLSAARETADTARRALEVIRREIDLQQTAQQPDLQFLDELVYEHQMMLRERERAALT